jgi:branched-chain amino acid transport system substrate-binding protein
MKRQLVLALALGVAACGGDSGRFGPGTNGGANKIGALLSLTGPGATLGQTSEAALELAVDDVNARFEAAGSSTRVDVLPEDTELDPALALEKLKTLAQQGVRLVVGPQSSSEIVAIKSFADSAGIVIFSQGSTAGSLSIPDDNVFRLVPDDSEEGAAVVELLKEDGIQTVVPLWREDAGNQGLHDAVERLFTDEGGTVTPGASYAPNATDFTTQLDAIRSEVQDAVTQQGAGAVAVYFASFEQSAVQIFDALSGDPVLSQVRWYGGDGVVQSAAVLGDATAAGFAATVSFRAPTYGLDQALLDQDADLISSIQQQTGLAPDAFALAAYDALHVAALAYDEVGLNSIPDYRAEVLRQAAAYDGATGNTTLNANGDRAVGDYDFYQVCGGGTPAWKRVSAYRAATGSVETIEGC